MPKNADVSSAKDALRLMASGLCMGAADLVPGVSGGTLAFITGIYEDLIYSIRAVDASVLRDLLCLRWGAVAERLPWRFLLAVFSGLILALLLFSKGIVFLLNHEVYRSQLFAAFVGLILASVFFCAKRVERWTWQPTVLLGIGAVGAWLVTSAPAGLPAETTAVFDVSIPGIPTGGHVLRNYDSERGLLLAVEGEVLAAMWAKGIVEGTTPAFSHADGSLGTVSDFVRAQHHPWFDPWIFFCGMIGISAMLLPGLSGSYLLSILGVYPLVIGAVADFSHALKGLSFDAEAFRVLFSLGLGILCGMAVFSRVVAYALKHYHDATLGLLIGFMLGALRAVWPYWSYAYELLPLKLDKGVQIVPLQAEAPDWTLASTWQGLGIALLACAAVLMIELWAARSRCAADS